MSAEVRPNEELGQHDAPTDTAPPEPITNNDTAEEVDDDDEADEEEEDDEPKLKYAKLTGNLTSVYRNGDSTSAFVVAGDKMVMGTHNGNIHVLGIPGLQALRTYHAHNATVTCVSISPTPPPPSYTRPDVGGKERPEPLARKASSMSTASVPRGTARPQQQTAVPNTPNNQIYIATSSLDGHVCVSSLTDPKDVLLRNFARPVQAVALSPDYKNDRTYLSGGLAGSLILTVGGKPGVSSDANANSAAATASGWLGSIGLGATYGKDTVLHSGEGSISTIKWSLTGKWVVWVNEEGIKIMRSHLRLGSENSEDAWCRIAHAEKPNKKAWRDMAGVWKARAEWIDDRKLESDDIVQNGYANGVNGTEKADKRGKKIEKLVVGWGNTAWILHVIEGGTVQSGPRKGQRLVGSADIVHKLQFRDCLISGISLYTPSLLTILAYRILDDDDNPIKTPTAANDSGTKKLGGRQHRHTGLAPQLRLVSVANGEEVSVDELPISRFETLSAQDYHFGTLWIPPPPPKVKTGTEQRGALEAVWEASGGLGTGYAQRMFSSSASIMSRRSSNDGSVRSPSQSVQGVPPPAARRQTDAHPYAAEPGLKLFIQSPYDCILAIKCDRADHLEWLLEHQQYEQSWDFIDQHPEIIDPSVADQRSTMSSDVTSPSNAQGQQGATLAEFFADDASQSTLAVENRTQASAAQKEKRRIGDLWLQQLVASERWEEAGRVAGKVLGTSPRWEHWVWTFAQADKFDDITPYIPSTALSPPLPTLVYEVCLGHYITSDQPDRVRELLEIWDPEMFDVGSVVKAIETRLDSRGSEGQDDEDDDRRTLIEALAKLYLASGRARDALRCYIRAQNAEAAFNLIREEKLMDGVTDDIPGFLLLRVTSEQLKSAHVSELQEASSEAIQLLAEEAHRGTVLPEVVIRELQRGKKARSLRPLLYCYFRALWLDLTARDEKRSRTKADHHAVEGRALVEDHADLAVELFAEYDQELLMKFLRASTVYSYDKASKICTEKHYIQELIYILSKTGQTDKALSLIIEEVGDVKQAIAFAKENPDLWDDLLAYSMDKPRFIRGLLEEVGTSIDPIDLVRRIPEGLEIEGLREGLAKIIREHQVQYDISEGVARVLRGEVVSGMDTLRAGQKKGVRFEVLHEDEEHVDITVKDVPTKVANGEPLPVQKPIPDIDAQGDEEKDAVKPGHCAGCGDCFSEHEKEPLIGFACGHVYHLSCLLRANPETSDPKTIEELLRQLGYGGDDDAIEGDPGYAARSVGGKVAHAHVIKNVVQGGCRRCIIPEGA